MEAAGISGMVNVSSALGIGISTDKSCSGSPRARCASRVINSNLLPFRRNPSFVVLHAQHGHDTQGLPGLLPRLDLGATILRMCQAWMGVLTARQYHTFGTPWRVPGLFSQ